MSNEKFIEKNNVAGYKTFLHFLSRLMRNTIKNYEHCVTTLNNLKVIPLYLNACKS